LAADARTIEELGGEPVNEVPSLEFPIGVGLLGATEDSLILVASQDEAAQVFAASSQEMHRLVIAARDEGVWSFLDPGHENSRASSARKDERGRRERLRSATEVRGLLGRTWSETAQFYGRLEPDGRQLDDEERRAAQDRLRAGAVCLRRVDRDRQEIDRLAAKGRWDWNLGPIVLTLHVMQRSLILALAKDPVRRNRAISTEKLARLVLPVHKYWN
jgi:hypothetical protein